MADFFEIIYAQADAVLEPVTQAAQSDWALARLLGELGFDLDAVTGLDLSPLTTALNDLVDAVSTLQSLSGPQAISDIEAAVQAVASVVDSVRKLLASLQQQASLPAGLARGSATPVSNCCSRSSPGGCRTVTPSPTRRSPRSA